MDSYHSHSGVQRGALLRAVIRWATAGGGSEGFIQKGGPAAVGTEQDSASYTEIQIGFRAHP